MKILFAASEAFPFCKTGGLADVAGSLPVSLAENGDQVAVILPLYDKIPYEWRQRMVYRSYIYVDVAWRHQYCGLFVMEYRGVTWYFVDNEHYFRRGRLYGEYDDGERFAFFSKAVVDLLPSLDWMPDVIHCNDWQTALVPIYLKDVATRWDAVRGIKTVFTIHNIEYQGRYGPDTVADLFGLHEGWWNDGTLQMDGDVNLMKAAMLVSDAVTTVSPTYAAQLHDDYYAHGMASIVDAIGFDDYWGTPAKVSKVTYQIYEDSTALMMALKGGSVDICAHLTSAQTAQLGDDFTVAEGTMNLVQAVYLNNARAPFDNEKVRQAMSYAINRQEIMDIMADGHGTAVGSSIYPKLTKYFLPELVDYYSYDPAKGKELLAEAGYPDGFDMTIAVSSNYQPHMDTAEVVVQQLAAIGIRATVQPVDATTWYNDVYVGRQFDATITGLDAKNTTARAMLERFVSDNGKNFVNYNNPAYDELYAKARACADDAEQTALYQQMETMLTETAANLYLQDMADLVAIHSGLTGYTFYPIYAQDLSTVGWE